MVSTRTLVVLGGLALLVCGGVLAIGSAIAHLAWGLPSVELVLRPAVVEGEVLAVLGAVLLGVARHRPVREHAESPMRVHETPLRLAS